MELLLETPNRSSYSELLFGAPNRNPDKELLLNSPNKEVLLQNVFFRSLIVKADKNFTTSKYSARGGQGILEQGSFLD